MAISTKPAPTLLLMLTFTHIVISTGSYSATTGIVSDLHSLQYNSPSGTLHLNEILLNRIFRSGGRSFYLIIFFDAIQLHNEPELNLKSIKAEFDLIANSFLINNWSNSSSFSKIFFCDIEFSESKKQFLRFGVQTLPNIRMVPPEATDLKSDSIPMDVGDYSDFAESMAEFIEYKTRLTIGRIHRPVTFSKMHLGLVIAGLLIWMPFLTKKLIPGETLLNINRILMFGSMFVYFFIISGSQFTLIRRIPLFVMDIKDPNNLMFYFNDHGMQYDFEGIWVGFLFTMVGSSLVFITRVVVRMEDSWKQRVWMCISLLISARAVIEVVELSWSHPYSPSKLVRQTKSN